MKKGFIKILILIFTFMLGAVFVTNMAKEYKKEPIKIAFFGDSITYFGWSEENGYVRLTVKGLQKKGINVIPIPAGIGGNTTQDLLQRMDKDIIEKHPDTIIILCGINDIFKSKWGIDTYKANMINIIEKALKNNIKVNLLTITTTEGFLYNFNEQSKEFNKVLHEIAKKEKINLIDINSVLTKETKKSGKNPEKDLILTRDGVHLNDTGNRILADVLINKIKF